MTLSKSLVQVSPSAATHVDTPPKSGPMGKSPGQVLVFNWKRPLHSYQEGAGNPKSLRERQAEMCFALFCLVFFPFTKKKDDLKLKKGKYFLKHTSPLNILSPEEHVIKPPTLVPNVSPLWREGGAESCSSPFNHFPVRCLK